VRATKGLANASIQNNSGLPKDLPTWRAIASPAVMAITKWSIYGVLSNLTDRPPDGPDRM
jgi:hypothetical protein